MTPPQPDALGAGQPENSREPVSIGDRYATLIRTIDEGFCVIEVLFGADGEPHDYRFLEVTDAFGRHTGLYDARRGRFASWHRPMSSWRPMPTLPTSPVSCSR